MQRDSSTATRLAEMSGSTLAIPYREPAWLWRTLIGILARGWKLFHDVAIYVIILGVGVSFAVSWLTSQENVDPSKWNVTHYADALAQNLLVAVSVFVLLAAVVFLMWNADRTQQRWVKRNAAATLAKQREQQTEEVKRVVEATALATVAASISSSDFTPHPIATLQPGECDVTLDTTYRERPADNLARDLLHAAARAQASEAPSRYLGSDRPARAQTSGETTGRGKSGLFVVGQHNMGKSRLVYEALRSLPELQDWTFVQWPSTTTQPFQIDRMKGKRVVILIDRLEDFAESPDKRVSTVLSRLPTDFEREKIPLIVIATARDGNNRKITAKLGSLVGALALVEVGPITHEQADQLTAELQAKQKEAHDWDGSTPGSIITGRAMPEDYEKLSDDAKCIMKILRLFDSAGIGTDPVYITKGRVCAVADALFDTPRLKWRAACDELIKQDLIDWQLPSPTYERVIFAKSGDALTSVSDYPLAGERHYMEIEDWPLLYEVFKRQQDTEAVVALGSAWWSSDLPFRAGEAGWPTKLAYLKRAAGCFRSVLDLRSAQSGDDPAARAQVQWYLADVLLGHNAYVQTTDESPTRLEALQEAEAMYRSARQFFSDTDDTETKVSLTVSLATTLSEQAKFLGSPARVTQLDEASALEEAAKQLLDEQTSSEVAADLKATSAYTRLYQARLATTRQEAARLMAEASEAVQGALSDRRESDPAPVNREARARAHGDVGYVLRFQASLASGAERISLLQQCEETLRHAVDILPAAEDATVDTWIWVHTLLADILLQLARLASAQAETQRVLAEAQSLCDEVENAPALRNQADTIAWVEGIRGGVLVQQAQSAGEAERETLLLDADRHCTAALDAPNRESAPEDWAGARFNFALLALEYARHIEKDDEASACSALDMGRAVLGEALEVYAAPLFAAEHQQALALSERIEQYATQLKCGA